METEKEFKKYQTDIRKIREKVRELRSLRKSKHSLSRKISINGDAQTVKNIEQHVRSFRIPMTLERGSIFSRKSRFFK